jgi:hypothetical protein
MQDDPVIEPNAGAGSARCQLHAVLVRILDTGVLLLGESGVGKSECALDLITRGHQLIADDAVEILAVGGSLLGKAPRLTSHLLEIRGLGIINVLEVFGENSICDESMVDLCIELKRFVEARPLEDVVSEFEVAGLETAQAGIAREPRAESRDAGGNGGAAAPDRRNVGDFQAVDRRTHKINASHPVAVTYGQARARQQDISESGHHHRS